MRLRIGHEFDERPLRQILVHEHHRRLAAQIGDVREILERIKRQRREGRRDDVAAEARDDERVAVGRRA
jgi:hypothetical protein